MTNLEINLFIIFLNLVVWSDIILLNHVFVIVRFLQMKMKVGFFFW